MPAAVKPAATRKPTARPAQPPAQAPPVRETRPVVHAGINVNGVPIPKGKLKLTAAFLRELIGFETETEYRARCAASSDPEEQAKGAAGFGEEFLPGSVELFGEKVRCWNNLDNRPFDPTTAEKYCQDELEKQWAGEETMRDNELVEFRLEDGSTVRLPAYTVNGETIIVGRTGKTMSGQHRIVGAVLAAHRWAAEPKKWPLWSEEPFIESLVVFGVSEHPTVVRTLDNVRPRTTADTVYTSDVFKRNPDGTETGQRQRRDLSKMLDAAVDLLWKRTGATFEGRFQTHAASADFYDVRHPGIKDAVRHVFDVQEGNLDKDKSTLRGISVLGLKPGPTAAALYLMSACKTDPAKYAGDRREKSIDFSFAEKAREFVVALARCKDRSFKAVKESLGRLKSLDDGMGGREVEKLAVLAAAWKKWRQDEEVTPEDLELAYGRDRNDNPVLLDPPAFGGIDLGHDPSPPDRTDPRQVERDKAEARKRKAAEAIAAVRDPDPKAEEWKAKLAALREEHRNSMLFFRNVSGDYNLFGEDAETLSRDLGYRTRPSDHGPMAVIKRDDFEADVEVFHLRGYRLKVVAETNGVATVTEVLPRAKPKPGPVPVKGNGGAKTAPAPKVNGTAKPNGAAKPAGPAPRTNGSKKSPALRGGTGT